MSSSKQWKSGLQLIAERLTPLHIAKALAKEDSKIHLPTEEQIEIIRADLTPTIVVAGAGSGKTETMAERVLYLVANGLARPDEILGLTFSRKAAGELAIRVRTRLRQLMKAGLIKRELHLGEPTILTYHSYASRIVGEYGLRRGIESDIHPLGEAATWQLANEIVTYFDEMPADIKQSSGVITEDVLLLAKLISEHGVEIEDVRECTEDLIEKIGSLNGRLTKSHQSIIEIANLRLIELPIVAKFNKRRLDNNQLTFDDQMWLAAELARDFPDISELEKGKYKVVILDEYQDTSQSQLRLLSSLFTEEHSVMAVGDPFQSIYGWRGASADTFDTFFQYFPVKKGGEKRFSLTTSWRNDQKILDLSNQVIDLINANRGEDVAVERLRARVDASDGEVIAGEFLTTRSEALGIADYFQSKLTPDSTAAILVRSRSQIEELERNLRERNLPVEVVGIGGLLHLPEIVEILSFLKSIVFTDRGVSLMRILAGPAFAIGAKDITALAKYAKNLAETAHQGGKNFLMKQITSGDLEIIESDGYFVGNIIEALDAISTAPKEDFTDVGLSRLIKASSLIAKARSKSGSLIDIVLEVIKILDLEIEVMVRESVKTGTRNINRFLDEVSKFQSQGGSLSQFLNWVDQALKSERGLKQSDVKVNKGVIQILTIHGAKGLEWDFVAVPGLRERSFPSEGRAVENWLKDSGHIPFSLRGDRDQLPGFDFENLQDFSDLTKIKENFDGSCRSRNYIEELRLGYVAFTRARHSLFISYPQFKDGPKSEGASELFNLAISLADHKSELDPDNQTVENPELENPRSAIWPYDPLQERREIFNQSVELFSQAEDLSDLEIELLDRDLFALIKENRQRGEPKIIYLPDRLSVSTLSALRSDPEEMARAIRRPMPSYSNQYARRGSAFHSWVEQYLKQPQLLSDDEIELDGSITDKELKEFQSAWLKSEWAKRPVFDVEVPFEIVLSTTLIRGRIDAVYKNETGYEIVDWKTGSPKSGGDLELATLQLAAYRLAFSKLRNIPLDSVSALFHYLPSNQSIRGVNFLSEEEIIELLPKLEDDH